MTASPLEPRTASPIRWPERYAPETSAVFVHNELLMHATPAAIWRTLLRAEEWPEWYSNARDIHFVSHAGPDLRDRTRFRWDTFGFRITSKVLEFEPERRLAWNAHGIGLEAYRIWQLIPVDPNRTLVITEETQNGWLARLGKRLMPQRLKRTHRLWLQQLNQRAQQQEQALRAA
jgi:hypothetical protein